MVTILVADTDLDSHELVHDILEINFRDVQIDRALNPESLLSKIKQADTRYDLILLNPEMQDDSGTDIFSQIRLIKPELLDRIVIMSQTPSDIYPESKYHIPKPFSLDYFGEVVKKACCRS